ncbi:MAG: Kae1-associated kinase Bud32 [Nitrososphaera sp.]
MEEYPHVGQDEHAAFQLVFGAVLGQQDALAFGGLEGRRGSRSRTHVFISSSKAILLLQQQRQSLLRRGAEADLYLTKWYCNRKAVAKVRTEKPYRHRALDASVRRQRTIHEARLMSAAKAAGVPTPFVYFVDPSAAEIIMEFVEGPVAKDVLDRRLCEQMGRYAAMLHAGNIVHGDLTTSNFVVRGKSLVLLDFGLSYYSERLEDKAVDVRLIKEPLPAFAKGTGASPAAKTPTKYWKTSKR